MARSDNLTGALLMMASMACFTFNDTALKLLAGDMPLSQVLMLRGLLTTGLTALLAWRLGVLRTRLPRRDFGLVGVRTLAELGVVYFFLTALFNMPIANVTAILQALPLTVTLAAAVFLREPVGWRRMLAILIGFVGVLLIIRPGAADFNVYSLYALCAVGCVTIRDLSARQLSPETPSVFITLLTAIATLVVFGGVSLFVVWEPVDLRMASLIGTAALFVMGGLLFSIMVMRVGDIAFIAPFRYTGLLWAMVLGWLVFGEWPDALTLLGAAIVVASGLFTLYREVRTGRKRPLAQPSRRH
ncbi:DMT family transporter [Roseovarius rhodophyticola]|uniref:DMT family transporter n=1 Tax=Roseovarius rhodophyticola TaxID=3080827 RepID=A0ABZ2TCK5_9RHOB|nr:DMT family transporter [Roseovarius sp. W115]MDV2930687.1 DMT family transporter [Roseovarius sp. W115]